MAKLTNRGFRTEVTVTLELCANEVGALDALIGYGFDSFYKAFQDHLGKHYMEPHKTGLKTFFESIKGVKGLHDALSKQNRQLIEEGLRRTYQCCDPIVAPPSSSSELRVVELEEQVAQLRRANKQLNDHSSKKDMEIAQLKSQSRLDVAAIERLDTELKERQSISVRAGDIGGFLIVKEGRVPTADEFEILQNCCGKGINPDDFRIYETRRAARIAPVGEYSGDL